MKLSPHFDLSEFTQSSTAARLGIDNDLPIELTEVAKRTADMLEGIRAYLSQRKGYPVTIRVSSGYRCQALNRAIGSGDASDHIKMLAVDFTAPGFGSPFDVSKALVSGYDALRLGQLIYEHTWVHVSSRVPDKALNRILTVRGKDYITGILEA